MAAAMHRHLSAPASMVVDADRHALLALIDRVLVPELVALHAVALPAAAAPDPRVAELAHLLVQTKSAAASALIDELRADGRTVAALCACVFEPTARALGQLWETDDCNEFDVVLALCHLQGALRRISRESAAADEWRPPWSSSHAVLVAAPPHETHTLGSVIASEMFWQAGWDVRCEYPRSDEALGRLVRDRWFDVLELSLSGAFLREHRLADLAASIRAAHAQSRNPGLVVVVDGRIFHERPAAFADVGADAGSTTALDLVAHAAAQLGKRDTPPGQASGAPI
jgi:hypothetical protein